MKVIEKEAARFNNTSIYAHRRSKKEGAGVDGRYIRIGGIFKLGAPNLHQQQFLGIHSNLIITINYPDYVKDLLSLAADLPGIPDKGQITWLYICACSTHGKGLWYFIPKYVWGFEEGDYKGKIKTATTVTTVTGIGGGLYHILNIPLLTRNYLKNRYKGRKDAQ